MGRHRRKLMLKKGEKEESKRCRQEREHDQRKVDREERKKIEKTHT